MRPRRDIPPAAIAWDRLLAFTTVPIGWTFIWLGARALLEWLS